MKTLKAKLLASLMIFAISAVTVSCEDGMDGMDGVDGQDGMDGVDGQDGQDFTAQPTIFENKSSLEPLVAIKPQFNFVKAYSLVSSTDIIDGFQFVGAADGAGLIEDPNSNGFIYMVNAEDDYAVARIWFDEFMNPTSGDWVLNSGVADFARQCSGTMWEAAIHGGAEDFFMSASESFNYDVKKLDPYAVDPDPQGDYGMDELGEFAWENAVPLPADAYPGKTVILGGDDDSSDSEGQITLYYSENGDADLTGGKIYVLRFTEVSDGAGGVMATTAGTQYNEGDLDYGVTYAYEFVEIPNGAALTKDEMETACNDVQASQFMRVEDVDYQKGSAANFRNVFAAVTGRGPGRGTYNDWGTVYRMNMDEDSPLTGTITQVISGNTDTNNADGNLATLQSPDNICVTENFIYTQEDPNSFDRGHSAYIYQSDLNGNNTREVLEFVVRNDLDPVGSTGFSGEYGALIDISDKVGVPGTFILNLQPHYWQDDSFKNVDGHDFETRAEFVPGGFAREDNQGGQIIILKGLPR